MSKAHALTAALMLLLGGTLAACGEDDDSISDAGGGADHDHDGGSDEGGSDEKPTKECPVIVADEDCDKSQRPIVFVHGTYGSGDNIANVAMLFGSNGYCQDRFVAVEYNSLGGNPMGMLDALIDSVREKTGQDQVDLMGHSQGTGHCITYLKDAAQAEKVAHYVNLSGATTVPNGVKTLSLSSENDLQGKTHHSTNADEVITFKTQDHFGVAASDEAFLAIYEYLIGEKPKYEEIQCGGSMITLEGIAEEFGDNTPVLDGTLEIYEIGDSPRERGKPLMTLVSKGENVIGPIQLKRLTAYEFRALDAAGKLTGHSYFAPSRRSNLLARFLAPPMNPLVALTTTDKVVKGPKHSALVMRTLGGAFRHDLGQKLLINGKDVLTDDNAGTATSTVGLFLSDQNQNGASDLGAAFTAPFIVGTDVFIDAEEPAWIEIDWNGEKMHVPNWPSDEGMISVTLK